MKAATSSIAVVAPSISSGETGFLRRVSQWMRDVLGAKSEPTAERIKTPTHSANAGMPALRVVARRKALGGESFREEHVEALLAASQQYLARPAAQRPGLQGRWKSPDRIALLPQR
jgi:hypothetical protein